MGIYKTEKPMFLKEFVRPAKMIHIADQTEPNASFHPFNKGIQHAIRPYGAFHPFKRTGFSRLFSLALAGHCHGVRFTPYRHRTSTFLRPFAPRPLRRFPATMDALTPDRRALRVLIRDNELPSCLGQVSLVHTARPSIHPVTKHLTRPVIASMLPAQRDRLPGHYTGSGLRPESEGSSLRTAESCSSSYGLHVRLRLLPTPPHGDAVTFDYRDRASPGRGLSPLKSRLLPGARIPAFAGMTTRGPARRDLRFAPTSRGVLDPKVNKILGFSLKTVSRPFSCYLQAISY